MASSIPAAKTALLAALKASSDPAFEDVDIFVNGDDTGLNAEERVVVMTSRDIRRDWAGLGQLRVEETYTLRVVVEVVQAGDDREEVETRMWEIATAVERTVLGDVTLGGAVRRCLPAGSPGELVGPSTDMHIGATVELRFECDQRVALNT